MKKRIDKKNRFMSMYQEDTGFYLRTGVIDSDGNDTGEDPFMSSLPELIDIGIMGHCVHGMTGLCMKSGVECYQDGLNMKAENMSVENFRKILEQVKGNTYQVALGGRGDVNKHEEFEEILKCCKDNEITPNYTTSGLALTDEEVSITKRYCGAVAVSFYRGDYTYRALDKYISAGIKTNIHYVLGRNSIDEALGYLKEELKLQEEITKMKIMYGTEDRKDSYSVEELQAIIEKKYEGKVLPRGVNAVIFLLHKPVGLGSKENVLTVDDAKLKEFYSLIDGNTFGYKIGFDSCNVPGLLNFTKRLNRASFDTCEAGRWSCYITSDMLMLPCSFDNQDLKWAVDLKKFTVEEAWNSEKFENFRDHFRNSCTSCRKRSACLGGCPIRREIVLCSKPQKDLFTNKEYEKIDFSPGTTIEKAVKELMSYKIKGILASGVFNGVTLCSDTVTMDGAYKEITGKTKAEFDNAQREQMEEWKRKKEEHKEKIPELTKVWMEKGREILQEDKWAYWDEIVPIRLRDMYEGMELGCCLDIAKVLNNNGTLDEAKAVIQSQDHSGMSFRLVCAMVKAFCSRGSEFVDYVK